MAGAAEASPNTPLAEEVWISSLDVSRIEQGWGEGRANRSVDNRRLTVAKGFCLDNPAASSERPILDDRPVGILRVEQTKSLLRTAKETDPEMMPALTVGLFAGLRRSEFFVLDWSEIDLEHRGVEAQPAVSAFLLPTPAWGAPFK